MNITHSIALITLTTCALLSARGTPAQGTCTPPPKYTQCLNAACAAWLHQHGGPRTCKLTLPNCTPITAQDCPETFPQCGADPCAPFTTSGYIYPSYLVVTVIYAPPGSAASGGSAPSSVDYGEVSSAGVSVSTSNDFQTNLQVEASGGVIVAGQGAIIAGTFGLTNSQSHSNEQNFSVSGSTDVSDPGSANDGIDHNQDLIYLLLGPTISVTISGFGTTPNLISWTLAPSAQSGRLVPVWVGELQNPALMDPQKKAMLAQFGVTPAEYPNILARDPFADNRHNIMDPTQPGLDPNRFAFTGVSFPYFPPYQPSVRLPSQSYALTNDLTSKTSTTTTDSYTVGVKTDATASAIPFLDVLKTELKTSVNWTWTNSTTQGMTSESKQTATATVGGPSYGYLGCGEVDAYYDRMYGTFVFAFDPVSCVPSGQAMIRSPLGAPGGSVRGVVNNTAGQLVGNAPVLLDQFGRRQRTFSDSAGQFVFFHAQPAVGQVTVGSTVAPVVAGITQITLPAIATVHPVIPIQPPPKLTVPHPRIPPG
jgi:hypothetical protein